MSAPENVKGEQGLLRAIGVPGLAANIVNTTLGASIFVLPAVMAKMLGGGAPVAFVICAIAQAIFVTCFAIAGSRVSLTGGLYAYVGVAFGRYPGFVAGLLNFTTNLLSVAAVLNILAAAAGSLSPVMATTTGRLIIMGVVAATLAAINVRSVRAGVRVVTFVTLVKVMPVLLFVGVGIFFIKPNALAFSGAISTESLGNSVLLLMFAFFGIESALTPSGEVRNPARTVPRAIYLALCLTTVIYILIQLVAQGTLGVPTLAAATSAPLADAAGMFLGHWGRTLLIVGATVSSIGYITSDILSAPRTLFAFGNDSILPKAFAHVHLRFRTPDLAIIFYAVIAFGLAASASFEGLAVMANVAAFLLYALCCAAAWELVRRDVRTEGKPFGFPGAQVLPFIAIAFVITLLIGALMSNTEVGNDTRAAVKICGVVVAIGSVLFFLRPARSSQ